MAVSRSFGRSVVVAGAVVCGVVLAAVATPVLGSTQTAASSRGRHRTYLDGLGIQPGKIKHVWLIILENKSYDATFTGLNNNTYLWQTNPNYGQWLSAQGANAKVGTNGCVYPPEIETLFNQLDAAHVSWKGYAQDLGYPDPPHSGPIHDAGTQYCAAPYSSPAPAGPTVTQQPNPGAANATDQYLPKHFPFPWFASLLHAPSRAGPDDCNPTHIASLFDPNNGLYHDLRREATTPAFRWITPNMCSDGHDAVCAGNNLSGGFKNPYTPKKQHNWTGGLYAADLFLEHVIPEIEASAAYRDGGLIDIAFDEAFPPFTYTHNSFANSTLVAPDAATSIANDSAGETLDRRNVHYEPPGPNTPLATNPAGQALYPGPSNNTYVDRPANCVAQTDPPQPLGTCLLGAGKTAPGVRIDAATAPAFLLVDQFGRALRTVNPVKCGVQLGARTPSTDPLYDVIHATTGGGDTGSILISPYIKRRSTSERYYNHYSWSRKMEDLFDIAHRCTSDVCYGRLDTVH